MLRLVQNFSRSTFGLAMLGGALLWAALPPLDFTPLAWIAPVFWIALIRAEKLPRWNLGERATVALGRPWLLLAAAVALFTTELLVLNWFHERQYRDFWAADTIFWAALIALFLWAARRWAAHPYRSLFLAYMFFWLADLQWIRLPYWAIGFGWLALGIYFGLYMPFFIAVSRYAVHRLRLPLIVVVPVVWTALELAQAHLLSGMTMGCLEHTQYRFTSLIQVSDLAGCYGVTFIMMFVAACLARMLPRGERRGTLWPILPAVAVLAAALVYGHSRMSNVETQPGLNIALIQGDIDIELSPRPGLRKVIDEEYSSLTHGELRDHPETELVVWPETVFSCVDREKGIYTNWMTGDSDAAVPAEFPNPSPEAFQNWLDDWKFGTRYMMARMAHDFKTPMIVGVDRENYGPHGGQIFNTAVLLTPDGKSFDLPPDRYFYDKTHLVPFGEYMPFADIFPWLQYLSPLGSGSSVSHRPACFVVKNINLIPSICYETVMPHVIRDQLAVLRGEGVEPHVLVNLTNDGWFWGSAELEQHLACSVYRAVENRRPMVIAANTGISASIDGSGHIIEQGPKRKTDVIFAPVELDSRASWYSLHGDWFAGACLTLTIALAAAGIVSAVLHRRA